ncbi:MAG: hypothetical protein ACHQVS_01265 [Candidatus Babeliales bacterium]
MNVKTCYPMLLICLTIFVNNAQAYQSTDRTQEKLLKFYTPITTNASGISHFLRSMYNEVEYAQDFLPNDFSHVHQLLSRKQTRAYAQSVLRLFSNGLKRSSYVNAYAFAGILEQLPTLLEPYFMVSRAQELDAFRTKINTLLYARFLEKFTDFKSNPTLFFNDLSQEIIDALNSNQFDVGDISIEELRTTTLIFLEIALNKLIWSPNDTIDTWKLVRKISDHILRLGEYNIIPDPDHLNDLCVSLIQRYCYFLDVTAHDLPIEFYALVKEDLANDMPVFLKIAEQEDIIDSKVNQLQRSLTLCEARARAFRYGIITG